ncbi:MAG: hypothetical protein COA78_32605 [Blastopirellula sp.]|nr:MAG: hypothetical protein COA78_32605 [Blastopirellula sp.]
MQIVIEASGPSGLGLMTFAKGGELVARTQAEKAGVLFGSALQISDEFQDEELIIQALNQAAQSPDARLSRNAQRAISTLERL